jgi:hypothetical protein
MYGGAHLDADGKRAAVVGVLGGVDVPGAALEVVLAADEEGRAPEAADRVQLARDPRPVPSLHHPPTFT